MPWHLALPRFLAGFGANHFASLHHSYSVVKWGQLSSSISQRTCENKGMKDCVAICCYGDEAYIGTEEPGLETNTSPCTTYLGDMDGRCWRRRSGSASSNVATDPHWGQQQSSADYNRHVLLNSIIQNASNWVSCITSCDSLLYQVKMMCRIWNPAVIDRGFYIFCQVFAARVNAVKIREFSTREDV